MDGYIFKMIDFNVPFQHMKCVIEWLKAVDDCSWKDFFEIQDGGSDVASAIENVRAAFFCGEVIILTQENLVKQKSEIMVIGKVESVAENLYGRFMFHPKVFALEILAMHFDIGAQKLIPGDTRGIAPSYPSDLPDHVNPILNKRQAFLHNESNLSPRSRSGRITPSLNQRLNRCHQ
jgi:hypothetical protein